MHSSVLPAIQSMTESLAVLFRCFLHSAIFSRDSGGRLERVLYLVDDPVDFVFMKSRQFSFGRQHMKGFEDDLTVAHEVEQFDVLISALNPDPVALDFVQILNPLLQSDFEMLASVGQKRTIPDLLPHDGILHIFGCRDVRIFILGEILKGRVAGSYAVLEVGDEVYAAVHI
jgi:hypothetical protein